MGVINPESELDPWEIGLAHEKAAGELERKQRGAFFTPRSVVEGLLRLALPDSSDIPGAVLDPTCGGGAFLVGALDRLVELGVEPASALDRVAGIDIDSGAVAATLLALRTWGEAHGLSESDLEGSGQDGTGQDGSDLGELSLAKRVVVGDALTGLPPGFANPDLIVGNPPFATPLKGAAFPESAASFREERSSLFGPYADLAGLHLWSAAELSNANKPTVVAFVMPQSILASRDLAGMRDQFRRRAPLQALWATDELVFEANVRVCGVVLRTLLEEPGIVDQAPGVIVIAGGPDVEPVAEAHQDEAWASLAARAIGAPDIALTGEPIAEMVTATAGFRDEYYALARVCREEMRIDVDDNTMANAEDETAEDKAIAKTVAKLATVGSLDPLRYFWGRRPIRFAKQNWIRPVVDLEEFEDDPQMSRWLAQQLKPKVVLPTQSRVFEPYIDREGVLAPVTPLLSIHADPSDLNRVAAVFLAPPIVAWAYRRWFGTALSVHAIKLAARDIAQFPKPRSSELWDEASEIVGQVEFDPLELCWQNVVQIGRIMNEAYGGTTECFEWWLGRLPSPDSKTR